MSGHPGTGAGSPAILQRRLGSLGHWCRVTCRKALLGGRRLDRSTLLSYFGDLLVLVH
jgi:hypothetical protein